MENLLKTIIEYIKYILKLLVYFDTRVIQVGGVGVLAATSKVSEAASKLGDGPSKAGKPKAETPKDGANNNKGDDDETDVEKDLESGEHQTLWIFTWIKDIIMSILNWFGEKALSLASTLLFASTAPILPFFLVMAGMYGGIKYFMFKIRRL